MFDLPAPVLGFILSTASIALSILAGLICALLGGAAMGIRLAGKDLGNEMAGLMGALYGTTHAIPVLIIGLVILYFI